MTERTISRMYDNYDEAQIVVNELEGAGVPHSAISLVANADAHGRTGTTGTSATSTSSTGTGGATGGVAGAVLGASSREHRSDHRCRLQRRGGSPRGMHRAERWAGWPGSARWRSRASVRSLRRGGWWQPLLVPASGPRRAVWLDRSPARASIATKPRFTPRVFAGAAHW